jgi:Mor family transcriptional regulator
MSYISAEIILPQELLLLVQEYADGQYLYIPRKADNRKSWGDNTDAKFQIRQRDQEIYHKYKRGSTTAALAIEYYLSVKSIQRILLKEKNYEYE